MVKNCLFSSKFKKFQHPTWAGSKKRLSKIPVVSSNLTMHLVIGYWWKLMNSWVNAVDTFRFFKSWKTPKFQGHKEIFVYYFWKEIKYLLKFYACVLKQFSKDLAMYVPQTEMLYICIWKKTSN